MVESECLLPQCYSQTDSWMLLGSGPPVSFRRYEDRYGNAVSVLGKVLFQSFEIQRLDKRGYDLAGTWFCGAIPALEVVNRDS